METTLGLDLENEITIENEPVDQVGSNSDCPQNEEIIDNDRDNYTERGDEGYEGDMEGDGDLMPPPTTIPK